VHAALLAELTLEEKASLCLGSDLWHTAPVPRLGIPALRLSDGPHGDRPSRRPTGHPLADLLATRSKYWREAAIAIRACSLPPT
jgi:hypothetical protein